MAPVAILCSLWICLSACSALPTTIPPTSPPFTTTMTTEPPTTPIGSCFHNGHFFLNGQTIEKDFYNCFGAICRDGSVLYMDHQCGFYTPTCNGVSERIPGQCCPVCHETTTPPTTIPPTSLPAVG
ncbi:collagen alpha-1(III) chain-like [Mya arenaria]|uniref:collagen alpha-1(III) chain-like n=1 Tax=Mya arenaria TaxID=6604 RepID=UPI0022E11520|nr:collagen alpha-1(III) chain-like [Mya arenaria]